MPGTARPSSEIVQTAQPPLGPLRLRRGGSVFILLLPLLLFALPLAAQVGPPLRGPLLALTPAEHDRIILYDITEDRYRTLSHGPGWYVVWGFSPDGCRLLYTRSDGPTAPARLYSSALNGSDLLPLVQYGELPAREWGVWEAAWSPDGERIAFQMIRSFTGDAAARRYHIAVVPAGGGAPVFYSEGGDEHEPRWSPDGDWLAYIGFETRRAGADPFSTAVPGTPVPGQPVSTVREADLWLVDAEGVEPLRLTDFAAGSVRGARWSPDGELIGFIYAPAPGSDTFWMIGAQAGAQPTQLSFSWSMALDLVWLPDGTRLVAVARDFRTVAENRMWSIGLVGQAEENATLFLDGLQLSHADYPRFSPDGRWLALRSAYALALVDLSSFSLRLLADETLSNMPAVWSPAGFAGETACR